MRIHDDGDDYLLTEDQPACEVDGTLELLRAGLDGELDGGPELGAAVICRGWVWWWAPTTVALITTDN